MQDEVKLSEINLTAKDGSPVQLAYEESGDILEIVFAGVEPDCALELNDHILLSFNRQQQAAAGLTILDFSMLATPTEFGPRTFALSGLDGLPTELTETVIHLLAHSPVNQFLKLLSFQPATGKPIPLTYFERTPAATIVAD